MKGGREGGQVGGGREGKKRRELRLWKKEREGGREGERACTCVHHTSSASSGLLLGA